MGQRVEFWLRLLSSLKPGASNKSFKFREFKKEQAIYRQGDPVTGVYFIKSGKVKVLLTSEDKEQRIIHIGIENDFVGYKEVILGRLKYTSTVMALEDAVLFFIPAKTFADLLRDNPNESWAFSQMLCNNLLEIENNMVGFNRKPVGKSVVYTLLWLDKYFKSTRGTETIPLSRAEFAHAVGTAKETLIRTLSEFKRKKLISVEKNRIKILNRKGLLKLLKGLA